MSGDLIQRLEFLAGELAAFERYDYSRLVKEAAANLKLANSPPANAATRPDLMTDPQIAEAYESAMNQPLRPQDRNAVFRVARAIESRLAARLASLEAQLAAVRAQSVPLTDAQIEAGRHDTFSTGNPFCPCTDKTMRKAVRWAERAHGISDASAASAGHWRRKPLTVERIAALAHESLGYGGDGTQEINGTDLASFARAVESEHGITDAALIQPPKEAP